MKNRMSLGLSRIVFVGAILPCLGTASLRAASPAEAPPLLGFSSDSARAHRAWEAKFRAVPDAKNLREYVQRLAARPHHVGSARDKENAE